VIISLSQGQLNILENCPRKFQHIYLDQLGIHIDPAQQERLNWGSRFHLLMQQRELGLPVELLVEEDQELQHWVTALVDAAKDVLTPKSETFREAEHCRTLNFKGYILTVIYDLLIEDQNSAQILDWKTYPEPKDRQKLANDWQTRLYSFVLAETSDYQPEQITMSYWFVKSQPHPQSLKFPYNTAQHEQTRKDLTNLLNQLTQWLVGYEDSGIAFPQIPVSADKCSACTLAFRCQRTSENSPTSNGHFLANLADIQEVSL
jgi:hypothetical protein